MTATAFEAHGLLYLFLFGGGVLLAATSGLIFLFQWFFGGDREKAMDKASIRGLIAIALMVAGWFFADRAVTEMDEDGIIIEIWEDPPVEVQPSPPPPPEPAPVVQIT